MQTMRRQPRLYIGLGIGVFSVSLAAIFIRLAGEAPPLSIAAYRLTLGAAIMALYTGAAWARGGPQPFHGVRRSDLPLILFSALGLALHFWVWTISLEHTSIASSVVLVTATPFLAAIASRLLWREAIYRHTLAGIGFGLVGGLILAAGDFRGEGSELYGDALAFLGAVAVMGYVLAGRELRRHIPAASYNVTVYACTAGMLLLAALATGAPFTGFSPETFLWIAILALVSQAIGHSLLNWSLGFVTATTVTISVMAEPVIATLAAIPILGETPPWTSVVGGGFILAGIYIAMRRVRAS